MAQIRRQPREEAVLSAIANLHKLGSLDQLTELFQRQAGPLASHHDLLEQFTHKLQQRLREVCLSIAYDLEHQLGAFEQGVSKLRARLEHPVFFKRLCNLVKHYSAFSDEMFGEQSEEREKTKMAEKKEGLASSIELKFVPADDQTHKVMLKNKYPRLALKAGNERTLQQIQNQLESRWKINRPTELLLLPDRGIELVRPLNPMLMLEDLFVSYGRPVDRALTILYQLKEPRPIKFEAPRFQKSREPETIKEDSQMSLLRNDCSNNFSMQSLFNRELYSMEGPRQGQSSRGPEQIYKILEQIDKEKEYVG